MVQDVAFSLSFACLLECVFCVVVLWTSIISNYFLALVKLLTYLVFLSSEVYQLLRGAAEIYSDGLIHFSQLFCFTLCILNVCYAHECTRLLCDLEELASLSLWNNFLFDNFLGLTSTGYKNHYYFVFITRYSQCSMSIWQNLESPGAWPLGKSMWNDSN